MIIWNKKIKAGALQFAILVSVVIAVVISAFVLLSYTQQQFTKRSQYAALAIKLANSGMDYIKQVDLVYDDSITFSPEGSVKENITLFKSHWGIYDKVISIGKSKNFTSRKIAFIGGSTPVEDRIALHLNETNSPLVVVGDTRIHGKVVLPSQGIKAGAIAGVYFQRDQLIEGSISYNIATKPVLSVKKTSYFKELLFGQRSQEDSSYIRSLQHNMGFSFSTKPKWLYRPGIITLGNQELENNIIVKSDTLIRVSAFAKAKNIILVAPQIEIDNNVSATFQAFASKRIIVGSKVRLNYPSALILIEDSMRQSKKKIGALGITLGNQSVISGSVLHIGESKDPYQEAKIHLLENSLVRGEVYSDQTVELRGEVKGSVHAHQFEVKVKGSIYKNHLLNTSISTDSFPAAYCGIISDVTEPNIVQWVY